MVLACGCLCFSGVLELKQHKLLMKIQLSLSKLWFVHEAIIIQRSGKKEITDSTSVATWKYFGDIEVSSNNEHHCCMYQYTIHMIPYKVIWSSLNVRVGCIKIVQYNYVLIVYLNNIPFYISLLH